MASGAPLSEQAARLELLDVTRNLVETRMKFGK
jgi:hypothetical protein